MDFGDVLLGFEGFKNKPDQWVLEVLLFWVFSTFFIGIGSVKCCSLQILNKCGGE